MTATVAADLDSPAALARAKALLHSYATTGRVAIEGENGDNTTYQVACEIINLGLSVDAAFELLKGEWNERCVPPWQEEELHLKVINASKYAQNDQGVWAVSSPASVFAGALPAAGKPGEGRFKILKPADFADWRPRPWLIPEMIQAGTQAMLYGPPGSGKSAVALDIALTLASGIAAYGRPVAPPVPVLYVAGEGGHNIGCARYPAWMITHPQETVPLFRLLPAMPWVSDGSMVEDFIAAVLACDVKPQLIVMDTLARAMVGLDENSARDASLLVTAMETIQKATGAAILTIHHTGKDVSRGERGSSAFRGAYDTSLSCEQLENKAVVLTVVKQKDAEERTAPWTFQLRSVGNSVVPIATTPAEHLRLIAKENPLAPAKVGATLSRLGAVGREKAVTTQVLASSLIPVVESQTGEDREKALNRAIRALNRLAYDTLAGYTEDSEGHPVWFMPIL